MAEVRYKITTWELVKAYCKFKEDKNLGDFPEDDHKIEYCKAIKSNKKASLCKVDKCPLWDVLETVPENKPNPQLCGTEA